MKHHLQHTCGHPDEPDYAVSQGKCQMCQLGNLADFILLEYVPQGDPGLRTRLVAEFEKLLVEPTPGRRRCQIPEHRRQLAFFNTQYQKAQGRSYTEYQLTQTLSKQVVLMEKILLAKDKEIERLLKPQWWQFWM